MQSPFVQCLIVPLFIVLTMQFAIAQKGNENCPDLRAGTFYSYPVNSNDNWKSERRGDYQTDINLTNSDTVVFKITWDNNCRYSLRYASGGRKVNREALGILKKHSIVHTITTATPGFYVTTAYLDAPTNYPLSVDTVWRSEQVMPADRIVFTALNATELRKAKLKDTSSFALLYLYRPKKFICKEESYVLYGNGALLGAVSNPSALVYKISRQGLLRISGQRDNQKDYADIAIHFGQKYYLFCDIRWNASRCTPSLIVMDNEKGEKAFSEAMY